MKLLDIKLVDEWHPTKNGDLKPTDLAAGSEKKVWWQCSKGHEWEQVIANRSRYLGPCVFCSNVRVLEGFNDIATTHPDIVIYWHPTKNGILSPKQFTFGSNNKVWWLGKCGHAIQSAIRARTSSPEYVCLYCSNELLLEGYNDLSTINPKLALEWHPTKNGLLTSQSILAGTYKKVWWECDNGHEWETSVAKRQLGTGCPYCKNKKALKGFNDLEKKTLYLLPSGIRLKMEY